jgi:hypothetical protein
MPRELQPTRRVHRKAGRVRTSVLIGVVVALGITSGAVAEPRAIGTHGTTERDAATSRSLPATSVSPEQACPPGEWIRSATAAWVSRVVEHAGYAVEGCTGSAWIGVTPLTRFTIWATQPWRRPPGTRPYTEAPLQDAFTDGTRVVWEAQGLAVWVAPRTEASDRLPGKSALSRLQAGSYLVPRRYEPIRFMPTPDTVLRACRSDFSLVPACPTRIPRVSLQPVVRWGRTYPSLRYPSVIDGVFDIERRFQTGPDVIRPPILHIEVEAAAGRPPRGLRFRWPTTGEIAAHNGLLREKRTRPVYLGRATWGGKAGSIALSPPYPLGGSQADHLVFRWRSGRTTYLVGLHAWEPLTEALATLRRVVASLPRG